MNSMVNGVVDPGGLEPPAFSVSRKRSNQTELRVQKLESDGATMRPQKSHIETPDNQKYLSPHTTALPCQGRVAHPESARPSVSRSSGVSESKPPASLRQTEIDTDQATLRHLPGEKIRSRKWGTGGVYARGNRWWIFYQVGCKLVRESAKTSDRVVAEALLNRRIGQCRSYLKTDGVLVVNKSASRLLSRENTAANIGAIAEMMVCADLMNRGYEVFRATNPNSSCDAIFLDGDRKARRVEVKTGEADESGRITACSPVADPSAFDILAVVTRDGRIIYGEDVSALPRKCFVRAKRRPA